MSKTTITLLIAIVILSSLSGYLYGSFFTNPEISIQKNIQKAQSGFFVPSGENFATIFVSAIDEKGKGVAMPLNVRSINGSGETLIDINNLVFWFDTQQSIQTAKSVAQNITGENLNKTSIIYTIGANASVVEGPSAGAALTIATIAALENRKLDKSVMITGTINLDGTIGEVGGILEKASAAKHAGAKLFLVPKGQGAETFLKPVESCSEQDSLTYCTTRYSRTATGISEKAGIQIKEVSSVTEAEKYFFS